MIIAIVSFHAWEFDLPDYLGVWSTWAWRIVYAIMCIATGYALKATLKDGDDKFWEQVGYSLLFLVMFLVFVYNMLPSEYQDKLYFIRFFD